MRSGRASRTERQRRDRCTRWRQMAIRFPVRVLSSGHGTPVNDTDYTVPFRFTGKLAKLTITLDHPQLTPADEKLLMEQGQRSNKASE
jgi:hypothetical protein